MELIQLKELIWAGAEDTGLTIAPPSSLGILCNHPATCSSNTCSTLQCSGPDAHKCFDQKHNLESVCTPVFAVDHGERKRKRHDQRNLQQNRNGDISGEGLMRTQRLQSGSYCRTMVISNTAEPASKMHSNIELNAYCSPLPPGWEQCLDMQTGEMYFVNASTQTKTQEDPRKYARQSGVPNWPYYPQNWVSCKHERPLSGYNFSEKLCLTHHLRHEADGLSNAPQQTTLQSYDQLTDKRDGAIAGNSCSTDLEHIQLDLSLNLAYYTNDHSSKLNSTNGSSCESETKLDGIYHSESTSVNTSCFESVGVAGTKEVNSCTEMVAVPCRKCLMFVLLPKASPRCPRCGTSYSARA